MSGKTTDAGAFPSRIKAGLEALYDRYHHRSYVHPDPLELLYHYEDSRDREIAGMVASSLAFGRVSQIAAISHQLRQS